MRYVQENNILFHIVNSESKTKWDEKMNEQETKPQYYWYPVYSPQSCFQKNFWNLAWFLKLTSYGHLSSFISPFVHIIQGVNIMLKYSKIVNQWNCLKQQDH